MALAKLGSFDKKKNRWVLMVNGEREAITCKQLGLPRDKWNERDSTIAAREYFQKFIDKKPHDPEISQLKRRIEIVDQLGLGEESQQLQKDLALLESIELPAPVRKYMLDRPDSILAKGFQEFLQAAYLPKDRDWEDRATIARIKGTTGKHPTRIALDRFLALNKERQKPQTYREFERYLNKIYDDGIFPATCESIDESTVNRHWDSLKADSTQSESRNKKLGFFQRFVQWLDVEKIIKAPSNLKSKLHRFKVRGKRKKIKTFDNVLETIKALPDKFKLWALMGLNFGMTQADLGACRWDWINLKKNTLTRFRVKTEDCPDAPEVTYCIWPETLELLLKLPNRSGLLFTTSAGKPMYSNFYKPNGKAAKNDQFSTQWNKLPKSQRPIPLGKFRSIGATAICSKTLYKSYRDYFLANVPADIGSAHYGAEADSAFFEVLEYSREHLGIGV